MLQAELKILVGKHLNKVIPLTSKRFLVGREQDCQLRPNSELVSRHHCVFTVDDFGVRLRDLGSTNGTRVNGELIRGEISLNAGDKIVIGKLELELGLRQGKPVAAAAKTPFEDSAILSHNATVEMPAFSASALESAVTETSFESATTVHGMLDATLQNVGETVILSPQAVPPMVMANRPPAAAPMAVPAPVAAPAVMAAPAISTGIFPPQVVAQTPQTAVPAAQPVAMHAMPNPAGFPGMQFPGVAMPAFQGFPNGFPQMMPGQMFPAMPQFPQQMAMPGMFPQMMPQMAMPQMQMMPQAAPQAMPAAPPQTPQNAKPGNGAENGHAAPQGSVVQAPPLRLPPPEETGAKEIVKPPAPAEGAAPAAPPAANPRSAAEEIIRKMRAGKSGG